MQVSSTKLLRTVKAGKWGRVGLGENEVATWWEVVGSRKKGGSLVSGTEIKLRNLATGRFLDFTSNLGLSKKGNAFTARAMIRSELKSEKNQKISHLQSVFLENKETGVLHIESHLHPHALHFH